MRGIFVKTENPFSHIPDEHIKGRIQLDHYKILSEKIEGTDTENLGPYSTMEEIKSNYRKLAQYYHPDKHMNNPLQKLAEEKLKDINIAYQILSDPGKRRDYDDTYRKGSTSDGRPRPTADKQNIIYRDMEPGSIIKESILITNAGGPYAKVHIAKPIDPQIQVSDNVLTAGKAALPLKIDITMRAGAYGSIIEDAIKVYVDDEVVTIPVRLETKAAPANTGIKTGNTAASGKGKGGRMGKGMIALIAGLGVVLAGLIILIVSLASLPPNDRFIPVTTISSDSNADASAKPPAKSPVKKTPSPAPTTTQQPTPTPSVATSPAISFTDANLENAIRKQIGKPQGDILQSDAEKISTLNLHAGNITDITPLKYFKNLNELDLGDNAIRDISPLSGLSNLANLSLNNNPLSDLNALSGLQTLTKLQLKDAGIKDISAISNLTNLTYLDLSDNQIKDISALSDLTNLESLTLQRNQIQDVNPLAGLTNLQVLFLGGNQISDYTPVQGLKLTSKDF